jgi:predicted acylesterase/phospholipase RssA
MEKPRAEDTAYFLICSGGAFRGAYQYWVIVHLLPLYTYRLIAGVSVGSINGIMAAMQKMTELLAFWDSVDGISGFLRLRWFWAICYLLGLVKVAKWLGFTVIGGLYSMEPLKKKLQEYVKLKDVKTPFVAGVVAANSGNYYNLDTRVMKRDHRGVMAVLTSSCMAPFMQPPLIHLEGEPEDEAVEPEIGFDGGYRNIFPIPWEEIAKARAEGKKIVIHAIGCTPLERIHRVSSKKIDGPLEMGLRAIEIFEAEIYDGDILQMREAVGETGEVHLWIPQPLTDEEAEAEVTELEGSNLTPIEIPGDSFDASRNTIQGRLRESKRMVKRGPTIYSGLEARA